MRIFALGIVATLLSDTAHAGETISGTNTYFVNEQRWHTGNGTGFWTQSNYGTFEVIEGSIDPGPVECHGSGFWTASGLSVTGGGICVYGSGENTHIWRYTANPGRATTWTVIHGTGKYAGMTGTGKSATRATDDGIKVRIRITDWAGEVQLPN